MGFVNEYITEADIKKYDIEGVDKKFIVEGVISRGWTIDRERDIWLMEVKVIKEVGPSGHPEPTSKRVFILSWRGERAKFVLDRIRWPKSFSESPFHIIWGLIEMDISEELKILKDTILLALKQALTVYGYRGSDRQPPNILVEFNF
jgi:hypothetical protein